MLESANGGNATQESMRLRDALKSLDVAIVFEMYPQEATEAVLPLIQEAQQRAARPQKRTKPTKRTETNATPLQLQQGQNLVTIARQNHVKLPKGMVGALMRGYGIESATQELEKHGIHVPQASKGEPAHENQSHAPAPAQSQHAEDHVQNTEPQPRKEPERPQEAQDRQEVTEGRKEAAERPQESEERGGRGNSARIGDEADRSVSDETEEQDGTDSPDAENRKPMQEEAGAATNAEAMRWIDEHPFTYDNEKTVEENAAIAQQLAKDFLAKFGETTQINTPARIALRRRIIEELYGDGAKKKERQAFIVMGLPASGKSSAVAEPLAKEHGALIIDSDEAKERLPEFADGLLASAVHEESSDIAERITSNAVENGDNIVLPVVGKTLSSLEKKIAYLKAHGYRVNLYYVDLPVEKAVERGKGRFQHTGRLVPLAYIRSVGLKPKQNFDTIKAGKATEEVDHYEAWSNDVDRGQRPRLLEEGPARHESESEVAGRGRTLLHKSGVGEEVPRTGESTEGSSNDRVKPNNESRSAEQGGFSDATKPVIGRTMGITHAYELRNDSGKRYTQYLIEHAEEFGFTKDQVRKMATSKDKPILVREVGELDKATLDEVINSTTGGASMGAAELAASDAARITSKDFADYDPESDGDITKASNDNFVAKLLRRLVPESGMNRYVDKNGSINQDGYQRVKRAMFSAAYQDADLIAKMAESMDDAIKNVSNGLQAAAANVARLNLRMKEGDAHEYPLAQTIAAAVKKYNAIKEGKAEANVEAYATENENAMFERDPDEVVKMVQVLDGYKRSGKKLGTFFNHLARVIDQQGSPEEDATAFNLGDAGKRLTLGEAIDRAKEKTETGGEQDLFGAPKYSISKEEGAALKEQTLDSLTKDVNNAFKGVGDIRHVEKENGVHEFSFRFQNGTEAKIQAGANITLTDAQAKKARKDHGFAPQSRIIVNGVAATRTGMASITLARFTNAVGTIYHEAFHIAYDLFLTEKEKGVIERAYKDFAKAKGQDVVEYAADRYRDWVVGKLTGKPVHSYAKLWQKIHDGAEMTEQVMRDAEAAAQIFHDIDNGEIWQRPLDTTTREIHNEIRETFWNEVNDKLASLDSKTDANLDDIFRYSRGIRQLCMMFNAEVKNDADKAFELSQLFNQLGREFEDNETVRSIRSQNRKGSAASAGGMRESSRKTAPRDAARGTYSTGEGSNQEGVSGSSGVPSTLNSNDGKFINDYYNDNKAAYRERQIEKLGRPEEQGGLSRGEKFTPHYSIAYHGTQHDFDQFDVGAIGTGEGSQVHGWGLYFAKDRKISEGYRDMLSEQSTEVTATIDGNTYHRDSDFAIIDENGDEVENGLGRAVSALLFHGTKQDALEALTDDLEEESRLAEKEERKQSPWSHTQQAKEFRDAINILQHASNVSVDKVKGRLFEVEIPEDDVMLDEQKDIFDQPPTVQAALEKLGFFPDTFHVIRTAREKGGAAGEKLARKFFSMPYGAEEGRGLYSKLVAYVGSEAIDDASNELTTYTRSGGDLYFALQDRFDSPRDASLALNAEGVKGIKYHGVRDGDCYVVFDDKAVSIIRKLSATRAEAARARAVADIKREIAAAFPGAKNVKDEGGRVSFDMPNGSHIEILIEDSIDVSPEEAARARRDHDIQDGVRIRVNGYEYTLGRDAVIALAKNGDPGTAYHEALHVAYELLFNDKEKAALTKKFGKDGKPATEERIADAYRRYKIARERGAHVPFGKLFQRISDLFASLRDHFKELTGSMTEADIARRAFRELGSGKAWERGAKGETSSRKFSLFSRAEAAENPIDNGFKFTDNEIERMAKYMDIPHQADELVRRRLTSPKTMQKISGKMDVDTLADMSIAPAKDMVEQLLAQYRTEENPLRKQMRLNMAAYYLAIADEIRRDFNAGGQVYKTAIGSPAVRRAAAKGSALRASIQARNAQIRAAAAEGKEIGVTTAGAVDNYTDDATPIVNELRKLDRGDGVHYSISTEQESRSDSQDGFSDAEKTPSEEETSKRGRSFVKNAADKLGKALHLKSDKIMLEEDAKDPTKDINLKQATVLSPSRVAAKVPVFRALYTMACRAMDKNVGLRNDFGRKFDDALSGLSKSEREELFDTLLKGDAEGREWTRDDLIADGASEAVADAYIKIRRQLNKAYHLVDKARRKPEPKSKTVTEDELKFLRENKFVSDLYVTDKGEDKNGKHRYLVSYMESRNYKNEHREISAADLANFRNDPGIEVVSVEEAKTKSGNAITGADGQPLYNVITAEGPAPLSKLTGYIPHFFHEYMIRVVDKDGNARVIGSARNQREAVQKGEAWLKENDLADGESIHVAPKVFDINKALGVSDDDYAPVMGDRDFYRVQQNLAKQNDMTLAEAKDLLDGAVRLKGRHRFFGNAMHRTGAQGYETDLNWALRHYFNSAARYVAMETEFKPKAISYFERMFGAFDKEYSGLAKYCKDYINDINGNPSALEEALNKALNSTWLFKKVIIPTFGDRAALTLGNGIANKVSYLTLGLNLSSALLNFTQLTNAAAYIGDVGSLVKMVRQGARRRPSLESLRAKQRKATSEAEKKRIGKEIEARMHELRILHETGVFNDIGLDSGSGYDQMRGGAPSIGTGKFARALSTANRAMDFAGQKSMTFFREADAICRRGTVLAAYEKAREQGKTHAEAIAFAKEVNDKANFQYGVQDAPNVFRRGSIVSQLLLQFKKYGFKELEVMSDFSPWSKTTSRKQKVMFWAMYAMLCGAMGVPALDWLDEIFGEKTGFYLKDEIQKLVISNVGNKRIAAAILYGAPALANMNISNRAGMSDVIPTSLGDLFAGPAASKLVRFAQDFGGGNWANALRDVSPGLYNLYAGYSGEARGKRGRLNDRYDGAWDRILRAVGFKSVEESVPVDMQRIISRDKAARTKEKQAAQDAYIESPTSENKARLKELGVNPKTVTKEAQKKQQTREQRMESTVPKKDAERYKTYVDWAKGW